MMRLLLHTVVFVVIAPGTLVVAVPALMVRITDAHPADPVTEATGCAMIAAGFAIFVWCVTDFVTAGRGSPDPNRPPTELVVRGLFRVVRNPMYVGVVSMIAGEAALFRSPLLLAWGAMVLIAFHLRVIVYEEPTLARSFGPAWDDYRTHVPRWLPRLRRH